MLGKSAVLLRTSYGEPHVAGAARRLGAGKLMGTPPTPPPPGVSTNLNVPEGQKATTLRARLELHRAAKTCNQCHGVIDPIGLAMENFDVIGAWRDRDDAADAPIDASTVLPSGVPVDGPIELRNTLLSRPDQFVLAFSQKLMMYGLGREVEPDDMPAGARDGACGREVRLPLLGHRAGRRQESTRSACRRRRMKKKTRQADHRPRWPL